MTIEMKIKNDASKAFREIKSLKRKIKKENPEWRPYVEVSVKVGSWFDEFRHHIEMTNKQLDRMLYQLHREYEKHWDSYTDTGIKKYNKRQTYYEIEIYNHQDWIRVSFNTKTKFTDKFSKYLKGEEE